ncbi:hypothetical protein B0T16DRAFT_451064 [Cercophora newfieldiana]|uniref:NmrA-like domain-containing protein n=1 Tax=Cercophora newfieldiana TaxID=92897 RepID=A0AA40CXP1_9PEZI|nr:hypothetical protein B0T16DRAFT_451064 [Cercophora newfieldiana]
MLKSAKTGGNGESEEGDGILISTEKGGIFGIAVLPPGGIHRNRYEEGKEDAQDNHDKGGANEEVDEDHLEDGKVRIHLGNEEEVEKELDVACIFAFVVPEIVTVVGATGAQGKGVLSAFLNNLSYKVRAITRNTTSAAARSLTASGVEVTQADLNGLPYLQSAFAN